MISARTGTGSASSLHIPTTAAVAGLYMKIHGYVCKFTFTYRYRHIFSQNSMCVCIQLYMYMYIYIHIWRPVYHTLLRSCWPPGLVEAVSSLLCSSSVQTQMYPSCLWTELFGGSGSTQKLAWKLNGGPLRENVIYGAGCEVQGSLLRTETCGT